MKKMNKKLMLSLSVLATPLVAENIVESNVANANATYNLTQNSKVYTNAQNAAKQTRAAKTYAKGTYYIYKQHNGMINISKTPGKPGAWINPITNKPVAAPVTTATTKSAPKATVATTTQAPKTTVAQPKTQPATTQAPQTQPTTVATTQAPKQTTATQAKNTYTLNNSVKTYTNAASAKTQKGARSTYASGNYFIFKEFNGMINISRVAGRAGAWINPAENKVVTAKVEAKPATKPVEQPKTEVKTTTKVAEKPKTEEKSAPKTTEKPKTEEKSAPKTTEKPKTEEKSAPKTTEKPKTEEKSAPKTTEKPKTEVTTQKSAEDKKTETKTTQKFEAGQTYDLTAKTGVYSNAAKAASKTGATTDYAQGKYYIYKVHNGMINISKTKGKAGAWINPSELGSLKKEAEVEEFKVLPFANKNYKITSPYGVSRSIASLGIRDIHNGVDFVTDNKKEDILSTEDGVVTGSGYWPYDGSQYVTIKHADNSYTSYWHLANNSITVKAGDKVKAGQKIGVIGSTGPSTGIHLHFMHSTTEKWWNTHQDPIKYLKSLNNK